MLFDRHGVIKRYETAEDILEEFFELRMEFYSKRRLALIQANSPPAVLPDERAALKCCSQ